MQNVIVWANSQSGSREIQEWDIWTSRKSFFITWDNWKTVNKWIDLSTEESTKEWAQTLVKNFSDSLVEEFNFSFHAMNMWKMIDNYPEIFIKEFLTLLETLQPKTQKEIVNTNYELNALLISFHWEYSENNTNGSHASYWAREKKKKLENSLLNSDATKKKIVDLEIFDSPSSKALWFTYLWVVGQFIEFIENDSQMDNWPLMDFLWEDYIKLQKLFEKYPLSWELKEWQISMKDMSESDLKELMNNTTSNINWAKLSYISGIISKLYLEYSMKYLRENKEEIFNKKWNRILLDLNKITDVNQEKNIVNDFNEKIKSDDNSVDTTSWDLFMIVGKSSSSIIYKFNPSDNNFNIIWNHFGIIPLMLTNDLIYNSWLLEKWEYIKSTKASSPIYTGNELLVERKTNNRWVEEIVISNIDNTSEIFATISIWNREELGEKKLSKGWIVFEADEKEFDNGVVPHSKEWFDVFNQKWLANKPFWLDLDPKAVILEYIWVQIATKYFMNPNDWVLENLKEHFKRTPDFSVLKWIFWEVITDYLNPNFEEEINNIDYNFKITNVNWRTHKDWWVAIFKVEVYNNDNLLLSQHTFKVG